MYYIYRECILFRSACNIPRFGCLLSDFICFSELEIHYWVNFFSRLYSKAEICFEVKSKASTKLSENDVREWNMFWNHAITCNVKKQYEQERCQGARAVSGTRAVSGSKSGVSEGQPEPREHHHYGDHQRLRPGHAPYGCCKGEKFPGSLLNRGWVAMTHTRVATTPSWPTSFSPVPRSRTQTSHKDTAIMLQPIRDSLTFNEKPWCQKWRFDARRDSFLKTNSDWMGRK